jgi:hypothetical protein
MCCGSKRQSLGGTANRNRKTHGQRIPPGPAIGRPVSFTPMRTPRFEYTGRTALSVVSPVTGRSYRFDHPGARTEADPRDRALLAALPGLRQIV